MRRIIAILIGIGVLSVLSYFLLGFYTDKTATHQNNDQGKSLKTMKITSSAFENGSLIPKKYTCDGENINPPLLFSDVPSNAKSLVLIVDDPDAPSKTWVHWVVFNIDSTTQKIEENSVPQGGILGITDFGKPGYGGPCPPSGTHHYHFKLYALDTTLDLDSKAHAKDVEEKIQNHILAQSELMGTYSRNF